MSTPVTRIRRAEAGLVVIDIQERLLPAIHDKERVVRHARILIQGARILGLPLFLTEQYRHGLGPTVPEIAEAVAGGAVTGGAVSETRATSTTHQPLVTTAPSAPLEKLTFSAAGVPACEQGLAARGVKDVVLCGIEAHVCVCQTCLDLLARGFRVFVVADAISSRTPENHRLGLERMRDAGAAVVSTEMVLFEMLERAGTAEFKQILTLVK